MPRRGAEFNPWSHLWKIRSRSGGWAQALAFETGGAPIACNRICPINNRGSAPTFRGCWSAGGPQLWRGQDHRKAGGLHIVHLIRTYAKMMARGSFNAKYALVEFGDIHIDFQDAPL